MPAKKISPLLPQPTFRTPIFPILFAVLLIGIFLGPELALLPLLRLLGLGDFLHAATTRHAGGRTQASLTRKHHNIPILFKTREGEHITPVQLQKNIALKRIIDTTLNSWNLGPFRRFVHLSFPKITISLQPAHSHHFEDIMRAGPAEEGIFIFPYNMPSDYQEYLIQTEMTRVIGRMLRDNLPTFKEEAKRLSEQFINETFKAASNPHINHSMALLKPLPPVFPVSTMTKNLTIDNETYPYGELDRPMPLFQTDTPLKLQPLFAYMPQTDVQNFLCDTTFNSPDLVTLWTLLSKAYSETEEEILISLCSLPEEVLDTILPQTKAQFLGFIKRAEKALLPSRKSPTPPPEKFQSMEGILHEHPLQVLLAMALGMSAALMIYFAKKPVPAYPATITRYTDKPKKENRRPAVIVPRQATRVFAAQPMMAALPAATAKPITPVMMMAQVPQKAPDTPKIEAINLLKKLQELQSRYPNENLPPRLEHIKTLIHDKQYPLAIRELTHIKQHYFTSTPRVLRLTSLLSEFKQSNTAGKAKIIESIDSLFCELPEKERIQFERITSIDFTKIQADCSLDEDEIKDSNGLTHAFLHPLIRGLERATKRATFTPSEGVFSGANSQAAGAPAPNVETMEWT